MKFIRDGIYGYIAVSPIEDVILNHPSVLRLHKVLQNSTVYHTYPFNRGSRFPHSLGTMHVAGKLLENLFLNSDRSDVQKIVGAISNYAELGNIRKVDIESANLYVFRAQNGLGPSNPGAAEGSEYYAKSRWKVGRDVIIPNTSPRELSSAFVQTILVQAVRLAAIVHDIGHFPYSHVIEYALQELERRSKYYPESEFAKQMVRLNTDYSRIIRKHTQSQVELTVLKAKLHERMGLVLVDGIYNDPNYHRLHDQDPGLRSLFDISFAVCVMLISVDQYGHHSNTKFRSALKDNPYFGYLYPLANIISGPVDCDRLDYLIRDSVNSGTPEYASFDQERIINHIRLTREGDESKTTDPLGNEVLVPAFDRRAFSALSDFFISRQRQFRWILSHHNVVRTDLALSRLILLLGATLEHYSGQMDLFPVGTVNETLASILQEIGFFKLLRFENLSENYRYVDDSWLDTVLQELLRRLKEVPGGHGYSTGLGHREDPHSRLYVDQPQTIVMVRKYLELIIERDTGSLQAIWKNEDRFKSFALGFTSYMSKIASAEIEGLSWEPLRKALVSVQNGDLTPERRTNLILQVWWDSQTPTTPFAVMLPIEQDLNKDGRLIHFVLKVFSPYEEGVTIVLEDGKRLQLEKMSSMVRRLEDIVNEGLMLYAFDGNSKPDDWKEEQDISRLGEEVAQVVFKRLVDYDGKAAAKRPAS
jgi:HD superfamily phosphohydrolase